MNTYWTDPQPTSHRWEFDSVHGWRWIAAPHVLIECGAELVA